MIAFGVKACIFFKTIETPVLPFRNVIVEGPFNEFLEMEPPGASWALVYVLLCICHVFLCIYHVMAVSVVVSGAWYGQSSAQNSSPPGAPGALGDSFFFRKSKKKLAMCGLFWPLVTPRTPLVTSAGLFLHVWCNFDVLRTSKCVGNRLLAVFNQYFGVAAKTTKKAMSAGFGPFLAIRPLW